MAGKRTTYIIIGVLLVLVLGGYGLFRWLLQPETVRRYVKEGLESAWQGTVEVGAASITLPPAVSINDIALSTSDGKKTLLTLGTFELVPSLSALLERKVLIEQLNLVDPHVDLSKDGSGELLVAKLFKKKAEPAPKPTTAPSEEKSKGSSFLSSIKVDAISLKNLTAALPAEAGKEATLIGPASGRFSVTVAPALAVAGSLTLDAISLATVEVAATKADLTYQNGKLTATIHTPTVTARPPSLEPIALGPIKGELTVSPNGAVSLNGLTIHVPPAGSIIVKAAHSDGNSTIDIAANKIALKELLGSALAALKPTAAAEKPLTIEKMAAMIEKRGNGPLRLKSCQGTFANGGKLDVAGTLTPLRIEANLTDYGLYELLEGQVAEYEFGAPIRTVRLATVKAVVTPTKVSLPAIVATMGGETRLTVSTSLETAKADIPFGASSTISVRAAGPDIFALLKLSPDSTLTGDLQGTLSLSGSPTAPQISGPLLSPLLQYQYSTTPAVPLQTVRAELSFAEMQLKLTSLTAKLFGGDVVGSGALDLTVTPFSYQWSLDSVEINLAEVVKPIPMLKDHVAGILRANTKGSGRGTTLGSLSADGRVEANSLMLQDAAGLLLPSVQGQQGLVNSVKSYLSTALAGPTTKNLAFGKMTSNVHLQDGSLKVSDVKTTGAVGLETNGLSFKVEDGSLGGSFALSVPVEGKSPLRLPVSVSGTLLAPALKLDASVLKQQLSDEVLKALSGKLLGKAVDGAAVKAKKEEVKQAASAAVTNATTTAKTKVIDDVKKKVDEKLGDGAGKLLRGLFR